MKQCLFMDDIRFGRYKKSRLQASVQSVGLGEQTGSFIYTEALSGSARSSSIGSKGSHWYGVPSVALGEERLEFLGSETRRLVFPPPWAP